MNEIEKILKDNMEDYESVKRQALKFIHENKKELSKRFVISCAASGFACKSGSFGL